jgi:ABC-type antimicrobial peptide transport system permease subunit
MKGKTRKVLTTAIAAIMLLSILVAVPLAAAKPKSIPLPKNAVSMTYQDMSGNSILFNCTDQDGVTTYWAVADGAGRPKAIREVPVDATYVDMSGNIILFVDSAGQYWVVNGAG